MLCQEVESTARPLTCPSEAVGEHIEIVEHLDVKTISRRYFCTHITLIWLFQTLRDFTGLP